MAAKLDGAMAKNNIIFKRTIKEPYQSLVKSDSEISKELTKI